MSRFVSDLPRAAFNTNCHAGDSRNYGKSRSDRASLEPDTAGADASAVGYFAHVAVGALVPARWC